ncbi:uncharacterized protein LOC113766504 [Coffea eugenioides]|uniref:uncharacterized protein LOC113766504 n=1 Tax=Coffea eugenioides TaxID=49369 RepID=UPI000F614377|nr:uncharacterized protein LOC113766504 [Coffea eugenioides]
MGIQEIAGPLKKMRKSNPLGMLCFMMSQAKDPLQRFPFGISLLGELGKTSVAGGMCQQWSQQINTVRIWELMKVNFDGAVLINLVAHGIDVIVKHSAYYVYEALDEIPLRTLKKKKKREPECQIHRLPDYSGQREHALLGEEPYKHLLEFDVVCNSMKPPGVTEEQIKMRAFLFSLKDSAKDWLAASLRKEICGIKQHSGESLYEYWERFKNLLHKCPQHQISEQLLIQYFYEGLLFRDRSIIDAESGGALVNKTPQEARELIEGMTENSQQFGTREDVSIRKVNEVETPSMQQQLTELTAFVRQLAVRNASQARVCGICPGMGHSTDMCPMIQEENVEQVNLAGYAPAPRNQYDPYSNTYNPGWRDHPNLSYGGNRQSNSVPNKQPEYQQQYQPRPPPPPSSGPSLEEMMKQMMATITQNQQRTEATITQNQQRTDSEMQAIRNQLSQMATKINRLESQVNGRLPSQPELNLKNVSAMTLRSGKEIQGSEPMIPKNKDEEKIENELEREDSNGADLKVLPNPVITVKTNPPPFPCRLEKSNKQDKEKEILEVFRKVEINIPVLDAIKQVPKYAKFLRDLCVNRRRLRGDERVIVGENVSVVLQRKLPPKCRDPGRFTVPCKIGNTLIRNTLLDLGVSINVMPKSMYASLNLGPLKETEIIIQLADRTNAYPNGLVEDVLVKVNELIFPANFYVLDMDDDHSPDPSPLLLGRPFLSTTQIKIDVNKGTLSMEFDGELVHFNIFDTMEHPVNSHPVFAIHAINPSVQEFSEFACRNKFKLTENNYKGMKALYEVKRSRKLRKKAALKGYLDPGGRPPISRKIELHPD